ncbi:MAG: ribosome small subunit-dependent GTPase A [Prolixibacteraceae bacterium]|nr:ribosome small subunit-dependent GTPase A [Prolixibacteraceae bacterium]
MKLEDLGYNCKLKNFREEFVPEDFEIGRIISEHKERYTVRTEKGEFNAEITGNLRFTASGREDFPAVGDWVALASYDKDLAIIHKIFPRFSAIKRQAPGQQGEIQLIATNIDFAFLMQAIDRDFNINRLERYLTICNTSGVGPVIVLTKTDLLDKQQVSEYIGRIKQRIKNIPVVAVSNNTHEGYEALVSLIEKGKTYCLLGSSGVGKSTLTNNLSGKDTMDTGQISHSTGKGRHVTSHRELTILENGGILIDNPGMREVGIADTSEGIENTFNQIISLSEKCKFKDCTHKSESGCAVIEAVENGELDPNAYENYLKMEKERSHFEATVNERRKKEKEFGKYVKNFKKDIKKVSNKYDKY